jgi:hypothetical protein
MSQIPNARVVVSRRLSLQVERYHTWPKVTRQSDGEHVAQVMRIYVELWGCPEKHVWLAILEHDMPEMRIGDLPFSGDYAPELKVAKDKVELRVRSSMGLGKHDPLTVDEQLKLKVADLMDCYEWGVHEYRMGNKFGDTVADNVEAPIYECAKKIGDWAVEAVRLHMRRVAERP